MKQSFDQPKPSRDRDHASKRVLNHYFGFDSVPTKSIGGIPCTHVSLGEEKIRLHPSTDVHTNINTAKNAVGVGVSPGVVVGIGISVGSIVGVKPWVGSGAFVGAGVEVFSGFGVFVGTGVTV